MTGTTGGALHGIVRLRHRWLVTSLPGGAPREVDLDEVLALLSGERGSDTVVLPPTDGRGGHAGPTPGADDVLHAAWVTAGCLSGSTLFVEGPDGATSVLDADDLRLLDAIEPGGSRLAHLAAVAGLEEHDARQRLGSMVAAGRVGVSSAPRTPHPASPPAGPASPPSRIERVVRWLREAWATSSKVRGAREAVTRLRGGAASPRTVDGTHERIVDSIHGSTVVPGPETTPEPEDTDDRIPVYAVWHPERGPLLALGMLTASLRAAGGSITDTYSIRRPECAEDALAHLAGGTGPAVLLCSDYVWTTEENLDFARRAVAVRPDLLVVHGGPSSPKYGADAEAFLRGNGGVAHILVRGEGEHAIVEILEALAGTRQTIDPDALGKIPGLTFIDARTDEVVRTPDRSRLADLDELPSPYLTGEFDHIDPLAWGHCLSVESNRGCPYGCTFCDWGSATLSRIRKFSLDRVMAEIRWAGERGVRTLNIADANFGIMARDVTIARGIAEIRAETGSPTLLSYYPAKNTTRHLVEIMDICTAAGIGASASISLQSGDPDTLAAIDRSNISTDHYVRLAAAYRRRGLPVQGDLLVGLPGQTFESYRNDLQFKLDHEIMVRTWQTRVLPNAPMNDPDYRARHEIRFDEWSRVVSTSTMSDADRRRMLRLRNIDLITERYGLLRHMLRYVQWEHGIPATHVMVRLLEMLESDPLRRPVLSWTLENFDLVPTAIVGWWAFYDEAERFFTDDLGIPADSGLETVLTLQRALMPSPGRTFPSRITLPHDYVAYYRSAVASLYTTGRPGRPEQPLMSYARSTFVVEADPLGLCEGGIEFADDSRDELFEGDFTLGANCAHELLSPLTRHLPHVAQMGVEPQYLGPPDAWEHEDGNEDERLASRIPVGVRRRVEPGQRADSSDLSVPG